MEQNGMDEVCLFCCEKMALFIGKPNQPQPHDEGNRSTGRPWSRLELNSSTFLLLHRHRNSGASGGSKYTQL